MDFFPKKVLFWCATFSLASFGMYFLATQEDQLHATESGIRLSSNPSTTQATEKPNKTTIPVSVLPFVETSLESTTSTTLVQTTQKESGTDKLGTSSIETPINSSTTATTVPDTSNTTATTTAREVSSSPTNSVTSIQQSSTAQRSTVTQQQRKTTTTSSQAQTTRATQPTTPALSRIEQELYNYTNALRKNPTGNYKRQKPLPKSCSSTVPVRELILNLQASESISREWSQEIGKKNELRHRELADQKNKLQEIGVDPRTWGENIAWVQGYEEQEVAKTIFENLRESDGHYCSMMNEDFTHIGVGSWYNTSTDTYWATQNFYE